MTATATWFEVGAHYIHDGRFRELLPDLSNSGQQIFSVVRRSGINRVASVFPADPSETPIQGGFNPADVIFGSTSEATSEVGRSLLTRQEFLRNLRIILSPTSHRHWQFMTTSLTVKMSWSKVQLLTLVKSFKQLRPITTASPSSNLSTLLAQSLLVQSSKVSPQVQLLQSAHLMTDCLSTLSVVTLILMITSSAIPTLKVTCHPTSTSLVV